MKSPDSYTRTAVVLHWLVALLILCAFPLGYYMSDLPLSPLKLRLYAYHKWLGMSALLLIVARSLWRLAYRPPQLPASMPYWQQRTAHFVHHGMYLLMLAVPLSGWLMTSALGVPVVWLGVLRLPDLVAKNKALGDLLVTVHASLNYALLALIAVHVAASLHHHFSKHDGTLARMLPFLKQEAER
jgi:cytochrome b561